MVDRNINFLNSVQTIGVIMMYNKTHIALFLPSLRGGGAENMMVNLANAFADRGLRVDLVLSKAEGPYINKISSDVRIIDLNAKRVLASLPGLIKYLKRECPSSLLSTLTHSNIIALWARCLANVKTRVVVREASVMRHRNGDKYRLIALLIRLFYQWADEIVAVSKGVKGELCNNIGCKPELIKVIYNPTVIPSLIHHSQEIVIHPWFLPNSPPVILSVGRLTKAKDFPTLIKAFANLLREKEERLLILEDGDERGRLERLLQELGIENKVQLLGFVENPWSYMRLATVFVLSSAWEGLPNTLIEAMAIGTPVIATNCKSGPAEILDNGRYGLLVPVGDIQGLSNAIKEILTNASLRNYFKRVGLYRARDFNVDIIAEQYIKLLLQN